MTSRIGGICQKEWQWRHEESGNQNIKSQGHGNNQNNAGAEWKNKLTDFQQPTPPPAKSTKKQQLQQNEQEAPEDGG